MVPVSPAGTRGYFPRMCEAGGMKVHQPELGSNLSRWIKIVHDLDLDSDQRTTLQWHSIMMRRHAYSLLAEILKMGIFGILYHHTFIYIHMRAYTCTCFSHLVVFCPLHLHIRAYTCIYLHILAYTGIYWHIRAGGGGDSEKGMH